MADKQNSNSNKHEMCNRKCSSVMWEKKMDGRRERGLNAREKSQKEEKSKEN